MSTPDSSSQGTPLLKRFDVYTVLLFIAFVAIIISVALLALELQRYGWDIKAATSVAFKLPATDLHLAAIDGSVAGLHC